MLEIYIVYGVQGSERLFLVLENDISQSPIKCILSYNKGIEEMRLF